MANSNPYQANSGYYPMYPMQQMPNVPQGQNPNLYQPQPMQMANPNAGAKAGNNVPGMLPIEESYIENILRLNKGKLVDVYTTFENNREWNAKVFTGIIEAAGRDHVILSDPETGKRYLIPMVYVDYVTFNEPVEYEYPFGSGPLASAPPR